MRARLYPHIGLLKSVLKNICDEHYAIELLKHYFFLVEGRYQPGDSTQVFDAPNYSDKRISPVRRIESAIRSLADAVDGAYSTDDAMARGMSAKRFSQYFPAISIKSESRKEIGFTLPLWMVK